MAITNELEWCDQNMHTNYPFVGTEDLISKSGVHLPTSFIVELQLDLQASSSITAERPDIVDPLSKFFLSAVLFDGTNYYLEFSYKYEGREVVCARSQAINSNISNGDTLDSRTIAVVPSTASFTANDAWLNGITGSVIIGTCADMKGYGTLTFSYASTRILSFRVHMNSTGIEQITFVDENGQAVTLTDNFTIYAGDGISFDITGSAGSYSVTIKRELTENEQLLFNLYPNVESVIAAVKKTLGNPIQRINGVAPDINGNFRISGGDCVAVDPVVNGVLISNSCSKPCCSGSTDDGINATLGLLEDASNRLKAYYEQLTTNVNSIQARLSSLIASRK